MVPKLCALIEEIGDMSRWLRTIVKLHSRHNQEPTKVCKMRNLRAAANAAIWRATANSIFVESTRSPRTSVKWRSNGTANDRSWPH
jgi:hypothetical protein